MKAYERGFKNVALSRFQAKWQECYPDAAAIAEVLRTTFPARHVRMHTLPSRTQLLASSHRHDVFRSRCNMLCDDIFGAGAALWVINTINTWSPEIGESMQTKLHDFGFREMLSGVDPRAPDGENQIRVFGFRAIWQFNKLNDVFDLIMGEAIRTVMVFDSNKGNIVAFNQSHFDVFIFEDARRLAFEDHWRDWLVTSLDDECAGDV